MAGQLVCIKHPKYDGKESPVLSCKTCCSTFVAALKARSGGAERVDPYKWLAEKAKAAQADRPQSK